MMIVFRLDALKIYSSSKRRCVCGGGGSRREKGREELAFEEKAGKMCFFFNPWVPLNGSR